MKNPTGQNVSLTLIPKIDCKDPRPCPSQQTTDSDTDRSVVGPRT